MTRFRLYFTLFLLIAGTTLVWAQETVLVGTVTDNEGEPLPLATVIGPNGKYGCATDLDGIFRITHPGDRELELTVSYIGYAAQKVKVGAKDSTVTVRLKPQMEYSDEVVVIGYGTQKKSSLTSSVETVKGEDIARMPVNDIDQALGGQVAGLGVLVTTGDPSSNKEADIRIRGINGAPLLVIDGVPRFGNTTGDGEQRLSDLNPDDIESISILKDAAASAVYGARAANGVILVQTKRGGSDGRIRVNYHGQYNVTQATYLPDFLNASEFSALYNQAVEANGGDTYEKYDLDRIASNPNLYGDNNLLDYLNKTGYSMRHSVSASGGNEKMSYMTGIGYTDDRGLYSNMGRDRFNWNLKLDATLCKGLTAAIDITGNRSDNKNTSFSTLDAAYNYSPLQVYRFTDGNLASISGSNPLINILGNGGYYHYKADYKTMAATLRYRFQKIQGLEAYLKGTMDSNSTVTVNFSKPVTLYLYDATTGQTSVDANSVYPNANITYQQQDRFIDNRLIETGLNYSRTLDRHELGGLAVFNWQDYSNLFMSGKNNNLAGPYPEVMGTATDAALNGTENNYQRASAIGRLNYGYDYRYFAEFSFRIDGSTKFPKNKRWGFFPTISGSWVLSNEPFFKDLDQDYVSQVKFRGSTGILGVDAGLTDYNYLMNYIFSPGAGYPIGGNYAPGLVIDTGVFPNEDLEWEESHDWNLGIDLGFLSNRLSFTYEYYTRYRSNMIMDAPSYLFPPSVGTGGAMPSVNFGKVKAWGWDMSLTCRDQIGKFKYNTTFNLSKTRDEVLDYGDESTVTESQRRVGHSLLVWSLYEADGLFNSMEEILAWPVDQDGMGNSTLRPGDIRYKDQDDNGILTEADKIYVRNLSYPSISAGISLGASWMGIRFSALFQGAFGYQQKISEVYSLESNSLQCFQDYHQTDTWTPENTNAAYPRIKFTTKADNNRLDSTFWLRECNYLRLKSLSIGYSLPSKLLERAHLSRADINLTAGNLFTLSSLHNMDPESLRGYPLQKTYGLSIDLGF